MQNFEIHPFTFFLFNNFGCYCLEKGLNLLFRCLSIVCPHVSIAVSVKQRNLMTVIGIWTYACAMIIPTILMKYGSFGYSKELGKCDYIEWDGIDAKPLFWSIGFGLPALLIVFSNIILIWQSIKKSSFLKDKS